MTKEYKSLGLMSGTSGDGVDASVIQSDGAKKYKVDPWGPPLFYIDIFNNNK